MNILIAHNHYQIPGGEDCINIELRCAIKHSCYQNNKSQTIACVLSTKIHKILGIYCKINYICLTKFNKNKLLSLKDIKISQMYVNVYNCFLNKYSANANIVILNNIYSKICISTKSSSQQASIIYYCCIVTY